MSWDDDDPFGMLQEGGEEQSPPKEPERSSVGYLFLQQDLELRTRNRRADGKKQSPPENPAPNPDCAGGTDEAHCVETPHTTDDLFSLAESGISVRREQLIAELREAHEVIHSETHNGWNRKDRWSFARILKGAALQLELSFDEAHDCLCAAIHGDWGNIDQDPDTAYEDFLSMWESIKHPRSAMVLAMALLTALKRADTAGIRFKTWRKVPPYKRFLALAYHLQQMVNDGECFCVDEHNEPYILLPVEQLAPLLRRDCKRISDYRKWAIADGLLKEVDPYRYRAKKATVFVFIGTPISSPSKEKKN
jgi:hypothetical protein